jgi:hypothetical protein
MINCPICGCSHATAVRHVAWGGFAAPIVYRLVRCVACGTRFSARSGRHEGELVRGYVGAVLATMLLAVVVIAAA